PDKTGQINQLRLRRYHRNLGLRGLFTHLFNGGQGGKARAKNGDVHTLLHYSVSLFSTIANITKQEYRSRRGGEKISRNGTRKWWFPSPAANKSFRPPHHARHRPPPLRE